MDAKLNHQAWIAWEEDQKTNPQPVNPHAFVHGYKLAVKNKTVLKAFIEYEIRGSCWCGLIYGQWLQNIIASYFVAKAERKYKRYQRSKELSEKRKQFNHFFSPN